MNERIQNPRATTKDFAPHCASITIEKQLINHVIGANWCNITNFQKRYNCCITLNKNNEFNIVGRSKEGVEECINNIKLLIKVPNKDTIYEGIVKKVQPNFALVEFMEGSKVGILKKDEVDWVRIDDLTTVLSVGNIIEVKVIDIIDNHKFNLSHKVLIKNTNKTVEEDNSIIPDNI